MKSDGISWAESKSNKFFCAEGSLILRKSRVVISRRRRDLGGSFLHRNLSKAAPAGARGIFSWRAEFIIIWS